MSNPKTIKDLTFDPKNARVRTAKGEAMIQESLGQVGAARSIVIDENGVILAGNGTVEAAGQVGIERVKVVDASGDEIVAVRRKGLTDEQKKKLAYYDNRTGDEAEWDMEQVAADLIEGFDFLDDLFEDVPVPEPETKGGDELPEDPAEVLREKWGVEYGDLWQIGDHRILCGDSTKKEDVDRLMGGRKASMVFTDPPYGMRLDADYSDMSRKFKGSTGGNKYDNVIGDHSDFTPALISSVFEHFPGARDVFIFGADYFAELIPNRNEGSWVVWDKRLDESADKMYGSTFELCWSKKKHKRETARIKWAGIFGMEKEDTRKRVHPTQKPAELASWFFRRWGQDDDVVVDVYAGSGTTLVAAHNEGRTCYAMEIDPAYVAVCLERMAQLGYTPEKSEG